MRRLGIASRERRVLVVGIVIVVAAVVVRVVPVWSEWVSEARASAAELDAEVGRAERSVRDLSRTLDSLEVRKERFIALAPLLVGTGTASKASGALVSLVSGLASTAGVNVESLRVGPSSGDSVDIGRVSVQADLSGGVEAVTAFFAAIEGGAPLLSVRDVSVSQPDIAAAARRPEPLRVELRVEGLFLNDSIDGVQ